MEHSPAPRAELTKAKNAVDALYTLWRENRDPTLISILKEVQRSGLFAIPETLKLIAERQHEHYAEAEDEKDRNPVIDAWETALKAPFSELKEYVAYISDESRFGTHQGIKGLEFPRVVVILDDDEARGWSFSYDKLLGAKSPSASDIRNQKQAKETSIDRTRRLFYVACSRAEESLAIIAYTNKPDEVMKTVLSSGWFDQTEIITK